VEKVNKCKIASPLTCPVTEKRTVRLHCISKIVAISLRQHLHRKFMSRQIDSA
jgi:hypothetical protein